MLIWLPCIGFGLALVIGWLYLGRAILTGELRKRGGGMLRRSENPAVFWLCIGAMFLGTIGGSAAFFTIVAPILQGIQAARELQGAWEVVQVINDGKPEPEIEVKGGLWTFHGDKLTMMGPRQPDGWVEGPDELTFSLDATQQPWAIDLYRHPGDGDRKRGICKIEGDRLTFAVRPIEAPHTRPTHFEFEEGTRLGVVILQRSKIVQ